MTPRTKISNKESDKDLVQKYRNSHDSAYLGELFLRYSPLVLGLCLKYFKDTAKAQDAVSDIFEKLLTELKRHEVEHFKSWLYMLSKNHCLMKLRRKSVTETPISQLNGFVTEFMESDIELNLNEEEEQEAFRLRLIGAIKNLKNDQRKCNELFYFDKYSYQEISDKTDMDLKQVKSALQNGKRNLKIALEK